MDNRNIWEFTKSYRGNGVDNDKCFHSLSICEAGQFIYCKISQGQLPPGVVWLPEIFITAGELPGNSIHYSDPRVSWTSRSQHSSS